MTTAIRTWQDSDFYLSSAGTANVREQLIKLQSIGKLVRALSDASTVDTNGDKLQDRLLGLSLGDLSQRHKYRALYDNLNDRFLVQRNSGTDASKTWVELLRLDASGNITISGKINTDELITTDGQVTLGGTLNFNGFYVRNLDKYQGELRTDSLRVYSSVVLPGATPELSATAGPLNLESTTSNVTVQGADVFDIDFYSNSANQNISANTETDITSLTALDLPNTNAVDTRTFLVNFSIQITETSGAQNLCVVRLYNGTTGTKSDTLLYLNSTTLTSMVLGGQLSGMFRFTPGASNRTKFGLSFFSVGSSMVLGASPSISTLTIQEVIA